MQTVSPARPWYRERWPWLLMAGPFVALVGCAITIYLAMVRFADQPITEGGTKRGLVVERLPQITQDTVRRVEPLNTTSD